MNAGTSAGGIAADPLRRSGYTGSAAGVCLLGSALLVTLLDFILTVVFTFRFRRQARAHWQTRAARRLAVPFGLHLTSLRGSPPNGGVIVCNHISYLDILVLAARMPCVFIAKSEVRGWPVLGALARGAGTIFIDRSSRRDSIRVGGEMRAALADGMTLVFFPEGTSSDGSGVLPFKSALFEGLRPLGCAIHAAALDYRRPGGSVADEVAYWRDMTLLPHLLNLLTRPGVAAQLAFARQPVSPAPLARKETAALLRAQVIELRARMRQSVSEILSAAPFLP